MTHRVGDLELGDQEEGALHWTWQRVGWAALAVLLLAALAGLFGKGPVANTSARSADGALEIEYARFVRFQSPWTLRVRAGEAATAGGQFELLVDRDYLRDIEIDHITPEPRASRAGGRDLAFIFDATRGEAAEVYFHLRAAAPGPADLQVRLPGREPLRVRQFVYP